MRDARNFHDVNLDRRERRTELSMISDNVEAYAGGSPTFARSATIIWPAKTWSFSRNQSARIRLSSRHCNHGGCYMIVTTLTTVLLHRFVMDHHKCR
jgi:hypothetical protein